MGPPPRWKGHELLAGRQPLLRPHPLDESGLGIADGPPDHDVGWAIAAHASLGQKRLAYLQSGSRFLWSEEDEGRCGALLRNRVPSGGERRSRHEIGSPLRTAVRGNERG